MELEQLLKDTEKIVSEKFEKIKSESASAKEVAELKTEIEKLKGLQSQMTDEEKVKAEKLEERVNEKLKSYELAIFEANAKKEAEPAATRTVGTFIREVLKSENFQKFAQTPGRATENKAVEKVKDYNLTDIVAGGTNLVTSLSDKLSNEFGKRKLHMRDILGVSGIEEPNLTYDKVKSVTEFSSTNTENGELVLSAFDTEEKTVSCTRIGNYNFISNRALKSKRNAVEQYVALLEKGMLMREDYMVLYGQGSGTETKGIALEATAASLAGPTFAAGAVASVATYQAGAKTLVTFAAKHALKNGYNITFANATHGGYNTTKPVNVFSDTQIVFDVAYVAEADTSAWTGVTYHQLYQKVDAANIIDAVIAVISLAKANEIDLNGILMNSADADSVYTAKSTTGEPVSNVYGFSIQRVGMNLVIAGIPVFEMAAVKAGDIIAGEWSAANAEILAYTPIEMAYTTDAELTRKNKVQIHTQEEIMVPVYNPFNFLIGNVSTLKTQLETP